MNILAMDTATSAMTVTVSNQDGLLAGSVVATERNHSIRLAPEISQLLDQLNLSRKQLGGIACGVGPGSYTGVRIGVTVAKTMAWALGIPVWALSSMHILAWSGWLKWQSEFSEKPSASVTFPTTNGPSEAVSRSDQYDNKPVWIVPMADARRGQAFTGVFEVSVTKNAVRLTALDEDRVTSAAEWLDTIYDRAVQSGVNRLIATGELAAFQSIRDTDSRYIWTDAQASSEGLDQAVRDILASSICLDKYVPDTSPDAIQPADAHDLLPNYTQLAEAESKWLAGRASIQPDSVSAAKDV